jgi:hypothetical protein
LIVMDADLAGAVLPYVTAVAGAYGARVVEKVRDAAADKTADAAVGVGRRLLRRLFTSGRAAQLEDAVRELGEQPGDQASELVLHAQLVKTLTADPQLAVDLAQILADAPAAAVTAVGDGAVAVHTNDGIVQTGQGSKAWQNRR